MKKYLVVEDGGDRTDELYRALDIIKKKGVGMILNHERRVGRLLDPDEYPVERLASYDAFFVDFQLTTHRDLATHGATFKLLIGDELEMVTVSTGMGVLLYLTDLIRTDRYKKARDEQARHLPQGSRTPRFYSFVEIQYVQSQFYAAAAQSWFGADYFRATPNSHTLANMLEKLDAWRESPQPRLVRDAAVSFDHLMDCMLDRGGSAWGKIPESFDWLRCYLQAGGGLGGKDGFKRAVQRELGMDPKIDNATLQIARRLDPIQYALEGFLGVYPQKDTYIWPEEVQLSASEDQIYDVLQYSRLFWTEPDVRIALKAHRARQLKQALS